MNSLIAANAKYLPFAGRVLLAAIFLSSGLSKLTGWDGSLAYVAAAGLPLPPALLLAAAIVTELGGGLALVAGFQTRAAALVLAGFSVVTAVLFHNYWAVADAQMATVQSIMFWKNLAMAGGFLQVAAFGPGAVALDTLKRQRPALA
ncbi:DoxX family protein [Oleisolibacter albus]|uniref:DoxX family protein n=1 Tax=Oleisolibacter albus TaxID=2171757 RepID=UPI000DF44793|nr:DoxX family protein [Oleisolibacter albus]